MDTLLDTCGSLHLGAHRGARRADARSGAAQLAYDLRCQPQPQTVLARGAAAAAAAAAAWGAAATTATATAAQRLDAGQAARCADAAGRVPRQPCLAGGGTAAGVRTGPRGSPFLAPKRPDEHKPLRISLVAHTPRRCESHSLAVTILYLAATVMISVYLLTTQSQTKR
jgi:hypothetical protein